MNSQTRPFPAFRPLSFLERVGRTMMDFGFAAFLEKFEDHFGRPLTKVLLMLIGLAIISATCSIIWSTMLNPLLGLLSAQGPSSKSWDEFVRIGWIAVTIGGGVALGFELIVIVHNAKVGRRLRLEAKKTEELMDQARDLRDQMQTAVKEAGDMVSTASLTFETMIARGVEKELLTPDQAALLRSLADTAAKTPP